MSWAGGEAVTSEEVFPNAFLPAPVTAGRDKRRETQQTAVGSFEPMPNPVATPDANAQLKVSARQVWEDMKLIRSLLK